VSFLNKKQEGRTLPKSTSTFIPQETRAISCLTRRDGNIKRKKLGHKVEREDMSKTGEVGRVFEGWEREYCNSGRIQAGGWSGAEIKEGDHSAQLHEVWAREKACYGRSRPKVSNTGRKDRGL